MSMEQRTCPSCGSELSGAAQFCPVCLLRKALAGGVESGESSVSEDAVNPTTPELVLQRFEHYELVRGEDGKPVELGRGAMGVTYKAFDVDLHCPVTLKVISEKYLSDESARLRFLREARAAASVRHPNVASPDCLLQEAMFLVGRRISLFWTVHGQTRMSSSNLWCTGSSFSFPPFSLKSGEKTVFQTDNSREPSGSRRRRSGRSSALCGVILERG